MRLSGLDLLRLVAASMVMAYHLAFTSWANSKSIGSKIGADFSVYEGLAGWTSFGWVGVQIFFVISGFIISQSAERATPASFVRGRILRLTPGLWVCCSLVAVVLMVTNLGSDQLLIDYIRSISFFPAGPYVTGVIWTLAVELVFYALVFCLLAASQFGRINQLGWALSAVSLIFWLLALQMPDWEFLAQGRAGELLMLQYGAFFGLGIAIRSIVRHGFTASLTSLCVISITACIIEICYKSHVAALLPLALSTALYPVIAWLLGVAAIALSARYAASIPQSPAMAAVGISTYPLYLIHDPIGIIVLGYLLGAGMRPEMALPLALTGMVALALSLAWPERSVASAMRVVIDRAMMRQKLGRAA